MQAEWMNVSSNFLSWKRSLRVRRSSLAFSGRLPRTFQVLAKTGWGKRIVL